MTEHFHLGDRVFITGDHLLCKGKTGTVAKWHHDDVYTVDIDNGWTALAGSKPYVIKSNEMKHIKRDIS